MENASKALIMAAEVLIGVMIISIGVYLFNVFSKYSAENTKKMEDTQIAEFNNQFLKFYGGRTNNEGKQEDIKCTIYDIVSLANLAKENNMQYGLTSEKGYSSNTRYIQIDIKNKKNIEKLTSDDLVNLIKDNSSKKIENEIKYYKCTVCNISVDTQRVNYMKFEEI